MDSNATTTTTTGIVTCFSFSMILIRLYLKIFPARLVIAFVLMNLLNAALVLSQSHLFSLFKFLWSVMCVTYFEFTFFTRFNNSQIFPLIYYVLLINFSPKLTWRDVQHIIVRAAKPITSPNHETRWRRDKPSWNRNSAGLLGN